MFAQLASLALIAVSVTNAVPLRRELNTACEAPTTYAQGYLEDYCTYHERYLALHCADKGDTEYFSDCCHPMLSSEKLSDDRKAYCTPDNAAYAVSAAEPAPTMAPPVEEQPAALVENKYEQPPAEPSPAMVDEPVETSDSEPEEPTEQEPTEEEPTEEEPTEEEPTEEESSLPSDGEMYHGTATYYHQNGKAGACGEFYGDDAFIVALPYALFGHTAGSSPNCGRSLTLINDDTQQSVTAIAADLCPTCIGDHSIDLSYAAFTALASESDGVFPISYHFN